MIILPKNPFRHVAVILLILFFQSSWWKIASVARNLINSVPQTAATTFAFPSVFNVLLCVECSRQHIPAGKVEVTDMLLRRNDIFSKC